MIVSKANYNEEENFYHDGILGKKYTVDHTTGEIETVEDFEEGKGDEIIQLLGSAIKKYLHEFFGENSHVVCNLKKFINRRKK